MASITDLFTKASNGTAPVVTSLASQKNNGATSASLSLATGWPTTTAVHGLLYKVDANNAYVQGTLLLWKAVLSGTTLNNFTSKSGTDDNYPGGSVIELAPTSAWADDIVTGLLVGHNTDGTHVPNLPLTTPQITTGLKDANGNTIVGFTPTGSAVNNLLIVNAASGNDPSLQAAGSGSNLNVNVRGKGTGKLTLGAGAISPFTYDYVASGCAITADSPGTNKNYSMTSGVIVINGNPVTIASVAAQVVGASKDRYIDYSDNGDGTGLVTVTEVANNAASPALAANSVRVGIVVAGATNIANAGSINQGDPACVLPIASSVAYSVTDSLGNLIFPTDPHRKLLGYKQITSSSAAATTEIDVTGLAVPVIVPNGQKIKITCDPILSNGAADTYGHVTIKEGGTYLRGKSAWPTSGGYTYIFLEHTMLPTAGSHTYKIALQRAAGTNSVSIAAAAAAANTNGPVGIKVERA